MTKAKTKTRSAPKQTAAQEAPGTFGWEDAIQAAEEHVQEANDRVASSVVQLVQVVGASTQQSATALNHAIAAIGQAAGSQRGASESRAASAE